MNTYEIFCENFSQTIHATDIATAIQQFDLINPHETILSIRLKFREQQSCALPSEYPCKCWQPDMLTVDESGICSGCGRKRQSHSPAAQEKEEGGIART